MKIRAEVPKGAAESDGRSRLEMWLTAASGESTATGDILVGVAVWSSNGYIWLISQGAYPYETVKVIANFLWEESERHHEALRAKLLAEMEEGVSEGEAATEPEQAHGRSGN